MTEEDYKQGMLTQIRFKNTDNHWLVGQMQVGKGFITVVGNLPNPEVGVDYKLWGKMDEHPRFGKQWKFNKYKIIPPTSCQGIYRYLVRIARWVGPATGEALIDKYGNNTLDVIRADPERVAGDIQGLTIERVAEMQAALRENEETEEVLIQLETLVGGAGLRQSLPVDLYNQFGTNIVQKLKENPYILTEVRGIGFPSADGLALKRFKVDEKSRKRQVAAIQHVLQSASHEGHVWVGENDLNERCKGLIGHCPSEETISTCSKFLTKEGDMFALTKLAKNESIIVRCLAQAA